MVTLSQLSELGRILKLSDQKESKINCRVLRRIKQITDPAVKFYQMTTMAPNVQFKVRFSCNKVKTTLELRYSL